MSDPVDDHPRAMTLSAPVVAIEKRSSLAFLEAVFGCWHSDRVAMPADLDAPLPDGVAVIERVAVPPGGGWFDRTVAPRHDDAPAQITLTSGTTGRPKPILLSHRALGDVTERLIAAQRLDETVREYVGVPVTFSFGLGRIRAVAAVGGASFLPERGFRADEFAAMLRRGEVNSLSAVPTLLRLVLEQQDRFADVGEALRWLEIGSQAMSPDEKDAIRTLFPGATIIQHYGLTEASRTTFLDVRGASAEALRSVGTPTQRAEVRITDEGLIAIRGPHVADGIVTPQGIAPLVDASGWLLTRDLGTLEEGRLVFHGRADDLINVGGIKVQAELFEERLLARLGPATPVAVGSGSDPIRGELVVVAHEDDASEALRQAVAVVAAEMNIGDGVMLLPVDAIPRTDTGKVRRREIGKLFSLVERAKAADPIPSSTVTAASPQEGVIATFVAVFGDAGREETASFHSLGGDSLHYVSTLVGLERFIPDLPDDWDTLSVGALRTLAGEQAANADRLSPRRRTLPRSLDSVRGLACLLIVALHVVGVTPAEGLKLPVGSAWHGVMSSLDLVRLPLFTAMSGYLYGAIPATREGYDVFMRRKGRQLLIPLLFATAVFWSLRNLAHPHDDPLLWAYVDGYQHLWFIDALLLIFALVAAVDVLTPPHARTLLCPIVIAAAVVTYPLLPSVPVLHVKNAVFLLPFFAWGLLLYRAPKLLGSLPLLVTAVLVAVVLLASQQFSPGATGLLGQHGWLRWVCGGATVLALLRLFPKVVTLERIAAYSFSIYLWHPAANGAVRAALMKIGVHATWPLFTVGLAVGVLMPIGLHLLMTRLPRVISLPVIGR